MPSTDSASWGRRAEKAAARKYGLATKSTENFDLVNPGNAFRYQVKSCREYDQDGKPGRLRIWYEDYKAVASANGTFIAVTYNPNNATYPINRIWKVPAKKVADVVDGDWYNSGHKHKGQQFKVPWTELR